MLQDKFGSYLFTDRTAPGIEEADLELGPCVELREPVVMMKRERHKQEIVRLKVSMHCTGADKLVVVSK